MFRYISYFLLFSLIFTSCTSNKRYLKMSNQQVLELIKIDSLNNKVYKILSPSNDLLSYEQAATYSPKKYTVDRYVDQQNDSIVLKFKKITRKDIAFKKTMMLYQTYGIYTDTINTKLDIDCTQIDSLLKDTYLKDKENRLSGTMDLKIDALNQRLLFNIFDHCDFHTAIVNKKESSYHALVILLHANTKYQKKYFKQIKKAIKLGYLEPKHLAYLQDKIATGEEIPQKYGTQSTYDDKGNLILYPYDNLKKVNKRRKELGLEPLNIQ
ncbi:hypothetical protein SAMN04488089_110111 [Myroides profundi]|uniref:Uncharacterized protein n=2 Tax=Myroides profundi TaxID=480520 RepID=A0AAJ4W543_MYRPR|nr:hypothetical protein SAMN04488089_110111 [Myroides profundi]